MRREAVLVMQVEVEPVSYTHLDVYKRQSQSLVLTPPPSIPTRRTIEFYQPAGASLAQLYFDLHHQHCLCLLYTSRCV